MIEDVSHCLGCHVIKAKVGQSDIIQTMIEEDGVMAGEGSGSVAIKEFQPAFDGFLAMGMILEMMAVKSMKISAMVKELPKYHIIKEKIYCPPVKAHSIVNDIKKLYASQVISTIDGIRIEWKDGWIHIRASATEPMIRIISESQSKDKAQERLDKAANFVSQLV
jgi:phosphomannomutase